jgi:hypothetical protein
LSMSNQLVLFDFVSSVINDTYAPAKQWSGKECGIVVSQGFVEFRSRVTIIGAVICKIDCRLLFIYPRNVNFEYKPVLSFFNASELLYTEGVHRKIQSSHVNV